MSKEIENANKIISAGAVSLAKNSADLSKVLTSLQQLTEKPEEILFMISEAEQAYLKKKSDLDEKLRSDVADLNLKIKENSDLVLAKLLTERKLSAVPTLELKELQETPDKLRIQFENDKSKAVAQAENAIKNVYENKIALSEANFKTTQSENISEIKSLQNIINQLKETNAMLVKQLDDKNKVEIERAKSSSVNITNTGK